MIVNDYKANGRSSLGRLEDAIAHLRKCLGDRRAMEIAGDVVTAYITFRQEQKAASSTINNELAALSRMFTLGIRAGKIASKPYIGKLALNNTEGIFRMGAVSTDSEKLARGPATRHRDGLHNRLAHP